MKVAFVSQPIDPVFPGSKNSMGIWICEVANRLTSSCEVIVYTKMGQDRKKLEYHDGVAYRRVPRLQDLRTFNELRALLKRFQVSNDVRRPPFASFFYSLDYTIQVARDLKAQQCDVVHILNYSNLVPLIRALNKEIKIVLHMQCEWLTQLDRKMIEGRLRKVDLIVGCSDYITEKIRLAFPEFASRCHTVHNGVDVNQFSSENGNNGSRKNNAKELLFVGRVSPEKGLHVLIDALRIVTQHYPGAQLKIVGSNGRVPIGFIVALSDDEKVAGLSLFYDGKDYNTHLQEQLSSLNIEGHAIFAGSARHSEVVNYYREADVLVNPSLSESFGMSLVEAMACQVPVVATRVGGMQEIVRGSDAGLLVEPADPQALAEAIIRVLAQEDLRKAMGRAGRQRAVELFSWDRIAQRMLGYYQNICECQPN